MEIILQEYRHLNHEARGCSTREAGPFELLIDFRKEKTNILRAGFKGGCGSSVPTSKAP